MIQYQRLSQIHMPFYMIAVEGGGINRLLRFGLIYLSFVVFPRFKMEENT